MESCWAILFISYIYTSTPPRFLIELSLFHNSPSFFGMVINSKGFCVGCTYCSRLLKSLPIDSLATILQEVILLSIQSFVFNLHTMQALVPLKRQKKKARAHTILRLAKCRCVFYPYASRTNHDIMFIHCIFKFTLIRGRMKHVYDCFIIHYCSILFKYIF